MTLWIPKRASKITNQAHHAYPQEKGTQKCEIKEKIADGNMQNDKRFQGKKGRTDASPETMFLTRAGTYIPKRYDRPNSLVFQISF